MMMFLKFVLFSLLYVINGVHSHISGSSQEANLVPLNDKCKLCICRAISGCNKSLKCDADVCGMFRITLGYWIDADRPTIPGDDSSSDNAYPNCTNNEECATRTVENYMKRYAQDCDKNGIINCEDYAAIHKYGGGGGCVQNPLSTSGTYGKIIRKCMGAC